MLRRMESALGRRWVDWDGAAALGRKALGWAALAGTTFLLCRAAVGRQVPFAMAFIAAALLAGRNAAALLAGCLAGALNGSLQSFDLRLPIGAAIALGGSIAWDGVRPALQRALRGEGRVGQALRTAGLRLTGRRIAAFDSPAPNRLARSPNGTPTALCAALAGASALVPGLLLAGEGLTIPAAAEVTAASVAAVAAAPFFQAVLEAGHAPRRWTREGRIGACLLLGGLCAGLARLSTPVGLCVGGALAIWMAPSGALAGAGFGAAMLAATGEPRLLAVLALGGATARLCLSWNRSARSATVGGAMLAAGLLANLPPAQAAGAAASGIAAMAVPEAWMRTFLLLSRPAPDRVDPRYLAALERRRAARKLRALGAAFGELAEGWCVPVAPGSESGLARLAVEQFIAARLLLDGLAERMVRPPGPRRPPRLRVERGAACASGEAGVPSGDSHLICMLDETRLLALICDGMGSGEAAAQESRTAARLLGRFLRAGAPVHLAVETVNALLLNRGGEEMFATADMLILDLSTGEAEFVKLAACPTIIARDGRAIVVEGGRLPLGILDRAEPERARARLMPGDVVLMASDGVADAAGLERLEALAIEGAAGDMTRLAERALAAAAGGIRRDDKTALALRVMDWKCEKK